MRHFSDIAKFIRSDFIYCKMTFQMFYPCKFLTYKHQATMEIFYH